MATEQPCYTLIAIPNGMKQSTEQKLKEDLSCNNIELKTQALKEVIHLMINGEKFNNLLMTIIRFVMPSQDHTIKKLLLLFWEIVPKYSPDGKLLQELILVCDAYRKDLQHPNEYIRGSTLRFLCKLKEPELLEPLMPAIQQCLEHRHAYVRRNAVLAIFTIYKKFEFLIPNAPERILKFLDVEQDASCKRNAFMMLLHVSQSSALEYLSSCLDQIHTFGDILQLVVVELIYKVCLTNKSERARFILCIYTLLQSSSPAVRYEAAGTLATLSSAPTAIRAVASCYIDIILKESDNNVKFIVLDRLISLRQSHEKILQDLVMDIVRILGSSDLELRQKTLEITMDLITVRTADELVSLYRKEIMKVCSSLSANRVSSKISSSLSGDYKADSSQNTGGTASTTHSNDETTYLYYLVRTVHDICIRFPGTIGNIVVALCEIFNYHGIDNSRAATEACRLFKEVIQRYPEHKSLILEQLIIALPSLASHDTLRQVIWIFGEFCSTLGEIDAFMTTLRQILGTLPLVTEEVKRRAISEGRLVLDSGTGDTSDLQTESSLTSDGGLGSTTKSGARQVTADGIYVTQTALTLRSDTAYNKCNETVQRPVLQAALFEADYMTAVVLSVALVKLFCRYLAQISSSNSTTINRDINSFTAESMLIISSAIHLAKSNLLTHQVNPDHLDRMWICMKILAERNPRVLIAFSDVCRKRLAEMILAIETERKSAAKRRSQACKELQTQAEQRSNRPDAPIKFQLLSGNSDLGELVDRFDLTLNQALGSNITLTPGSGKQGDAYATSRLSKVHQLTGFSDPVYAEAYVHVNQFDIVLDVLIVNQTTDTLQNLTLELSTLGDLKLVEKPTPLTVAPQDFANIKANIKVSSTENGIIFGNIVYDVRGSSGECSCIVLNDIHIDIMEYIVPATCSNTEYRQMWSEFEWENKVTVNTQITDLHAYLAHITTKTNLRCLTPMETLQGDCDYLCVTLYAKSIFGEHVLANLCLERTEPGQPISGHVRIRAKTQGMAVTMGEKVSTSQKLWVNNLEDKENELGPVELINGF